ncbi:MAG TPA: hypothetical protein VJQ25_10485, partial [Nitrospira sp.]|nr:hypothetical protein [Nitrospira sp.]
MDRLSAAELDLLGRVVEKPDLQPFFFRKVAGLKWFDDLQKHGFFNPDKNPPPNPDKEQGYVNVPFWPASEYLVSIAEELSEKKNAGYAEKALEIVRRVTAYAKEHHFSNYRTWWQFGKVIRHIPSSLVSIRDIDLVDFWLDDPYDRSLVGTEVGAKWLVTLLDEDDKHSGQLALRLVDVLFKTTPPPKTSSARSSRRGLFRFDEWHAEKISERVAAKAGVRLGFAAAKIFQGHLELVLQNTDNDKWSSVWRRAIEDHDQDKHNSDAESILV